MKKFNWEEFKDKNNKIAVHCKTKEEAKFFCKQMHEHGMEWKDGDSYLDISCWYGYRDKTCYNNHGGYSSYIFYEEEKYTILEWSDYMKKEFTKSDLKDGMVVEYRKGNKLVVFGEKLLTKTSNDSMDGFEDDLTDKAFKEKDYDIIKVYKVNTKKVRQLNDVFDDDNLELIWERQETKSMTTEEMRQKLEELTGEKIEVEPSREEMIGTIYKYCRENKCSDCVLPEIGCNFANYSNDEAKKAYEEIMEDGRKES